MEDNAIRDGFANLKPGTDYDPLYQSALCRAKADWLVGMYHNADRRRTMGKITAALPDMDGDMRALAQQTLSKLERMTDTDYDNQKFNFTDE